MAAGQRLSGWTDASPCPSRSRRFGPPREKVDTSPSWTQLWAYVDYGKPFGSIIFTKIRTENRSNRFDISLWNSHSLQLTLKHVLCDNHLLYWNLSGQNMQTELHCDVTELWSDIWLTRQFWKHCKVTVTRAAQYKFDNNDVTKAVKSLKARTFWKCCPACCVVTEIYIQKMSWFFLNLSKSSFFTFDCYGLFPLYIHFFF